MLHFHPEPKVVSANAINKRSDKSRQIENKKKSYKCEHCSQTYKRKHFLELHMAKTHTNFKTEIKFYETRPRREC